MNEINKILKTLTDWREKSKHLLDINKLYLFGSSINNNGNLFDLRTSDIDLVILIPDAIKTATERKEWLKNLQQQKTDLELEFIKLFKRDNTKKAIVSIIALTDFELKANIHKSKVPTFYNKNVFLDIDTPNLKAQPLLQNPKLNISDNARQTIEFCAEVRNKYLAVSFIHQENKIGWNSTTDIVPKEILRICAILSNGQNSNHNIEDQTDISIGLNYLQQYLQSKSKENDDFANLNNWLARNLLNKNPNYSLTEIEYLFLTEMLFDIAANTKYKQVNVKKKAKELLPAEILQKKTTTKSNISPSSIYSNRVSLEKKIKSIFESSSTKLYLWGASGVGKTHLIENCLFEICNQSKFDYIFKIKPSINLTLNEFLNQLIEFFELPPSSSTELIYKQNLLLEKFKSCKAVILIDSFEKIKNHNEFVEFIERFPINIKVVVTTTLTIELPNFIYIQIEKLEPNSIKDFTLQIISKKYPSYKADKRFNWSAFYKVTNGIPNLISKVLYYIIMQGTDFNEIEKSLKNDKSLQSSDSVISYIWSTNLSENAKKILKALSIINGKVSVSVLEEITKLSKYSIKKELQILRDTSFISEFRNHPETYIEIQDSVWFFLHNSSLLNNKVLANSIHSVAKRILKKNGGLNNYKGLKELQTYWDFINAMTTLVLSSTDYLLKKFYWEKLEYFLHYKGYYQRRVEVGEKIIEDAKKQKDKLLIAKIQLEIAESKWYLYCDKKSTLSLIQNSKTLLKKTDDKVALGFAYYYEGRIYRQTGNLKAANKSLNTALSIGKGKDKYLTGYALNNIGNLNVLENNFEQGISNYKNSLKIWKDLKDKAMEGIVYRNMIKVYSKQNNISECEQYFSKAFDIFQELSIDTEAGQLMLEISDLYIRNNMKPKAKTLLKTANSIFVKTNSMYYENIINSLQTKLKTYEV